MLRVFELNVKNPSFAKQKNSLNAKGFLWRTKCIVCNCILDKCIFRFSSSKKTLPSHLSYFWANDDGCGICLRMWKPVKEAALKILNSSCLYITWSVIMRFFPMDPHDCVIMESQCGHGSSTQCCQAMQANFSWFLFLLFCFSKSNRMTPTKLAASISIQFGNLLTYFLFHHFAFTCFLFNTC